METSSETRQESSHVESDESVHKSIPNSDSGLVITIHNTAAVQPDAPIIVTGILLHVHFIVSVS